MKASRSPDTPDKVSEILRQRIQSNVLAPGEWLREGPICREFDIGRSVARRILRTLSDDGLIELEENRGARVLETTVEEVFDLYEVRAALYGLAARFACMRMSDTAIVKVRADIDDLLEAAEGGASAEKIIGLSEEIFMQLAEYASFEAQKMIVSVRRKTRFHYSYVALALSTDGPGPYQHWRRVSFALSKRDVAEASQAARDILYYMQGEVARIMLAQGPQTRR